MHSEIVPQLTDFLTAGDGSWKILVVESLSYLPKLRQMFPHAELFAVTRDAAKANDASYQTFGVNWEILDYLITPLPYPKAYFDYIISDLTLEPADNPQDIAAGFGMFLKDTGQWLTSFRNIRYWKVIDDLKDGHYYGLVTRLYARPEFERLLYASFYKYVTMSPQINAAPPGMIDELTAAGFENIMDDLEAEFWLVRAARSMPEMSLLKSMYTADERKKLSRLLHRLEYDVTPAQAAADFWHLYDKAQMFPDYVAAFVRQTVCHEAEFYRRLAQYSAERQTDVSALCQAAAKEDLV